MKPFPRCISALILTASLLGGTWNGLAGQRDIRGPLGSRFFGDSVKALPNGNVVVTDITFSIPGGANSVGAVYLYGRTGNLISRITGSREEDRIGNGGITVLANGNFVIVSYRWDNPAPPFPGATTATVDAGAVTWGNMETGVSGVVSEANSLVGTSPNDHVGDAETRRQGGVVALSNGNYVVASPTWDAPSRSNAGAVTWCNGAVGRSGVVSAENSLIGSSAGDGIGGGVIFSSTSYGPGVTEVGSSHYVVTSPRWRNGTLSSVGAITWCDGAAGRTGTVSAANSMIGSQAFDNVGGTNNPVQSVTVLTNGNYAVTSLNWKNGTAAGAGAVTWCPGNAPITGIVSAANSLVGSTADDRVGQITELGLIPFSSGVVALTNGNYVVCSVNWDKGAVVNAGAVTWGDGSTGTSGVVAAGNSLTGTTGSDYLGRATPLPGGDYVVSSHLWDNGTVANAGAARKMNGTVPASGLMTAANSLVGTKPADQVSASGVIPLANGNYVVASGGWNKPTVNLVGAVTWVSGTLGLTGPVTESNSLTGTFLRDHVGGYGPSGSSGPGGGVVALTNGNYVVSTPQWRSGSTLNVGAVTWVDGTTGRTGVVTAANSMTGAAAGDNFGGDAFYNGVGVKALANGNYVIGSPAVKNGTFTEAGAVTWCRGDQPATGVVSAANSLLGTANSQFLGRVLPTALANGDYVLPVGFKAVLLGKGTEPIPGVVDYSNSSIADRVHANAPKFDAVSGPGGSTVHVGWSTDSRVGILSNQFASQPELEVLRLDGTQVVSGSPLAMGEVLVGGRKILNLQMVNFGYADLTLGSQTSTNSQFNLALPPGISTFPHGQRNLVSVVFTPTQSGPQTGVIRFTTNDPATPQFEILVSGEGNAVLPVKISDLPVPPGSGAFGTHVVYLPNGNLVVTDPSYDAPGPVVDVGAAYLYSPAGEMISKLTGSTAGDQVGVSGVTVLTNGNYLVCTSLWKNNGAYDCGAVTWGSATMGVSGVVSPTNSLVGSNNADDVGGYKKTPGKGLVYPLPNGNYVVGSPKWGNPGPNAGGRGAVTWGNGSTGVSGEVSSSNSLLGVDTSAGVANYGIFVLANGNFVVGSSGLSLSPYISGVVTLVSGTAPTTGLVSLTNSMGGLIPQRVTPLADGNFVVGSASYGTEGTSSLSKGAAIWMSGTTPRTGVFQPAEALLGGAFGDQIGSGGIVDLGQGRYAVMSPSWNGGRGAVTWCRSGGLISGTVDAANSLAGTAVTDSVGSGGVVLLEDGNAVVASPLWSGPAGSRSAVTWVPGASGLVGAVTAQNSLTGAGYGGITPLAGGRYVVVNPYWKGVGAVTWMDGPTAGQGTVYEGNSIIGSSPGDALGSDGITRLANGNYVILSRGWSGKRGAVTWVDGSKRSVFTVSAANSLVGSTPEDFFGKRNGQPYYPAVVTALRNGHYILTTPAWDMGTVVDAGAITWGNGNGGSAGALSASNSLTGRMANDFLGHTAVFRGADGAFAVGSQQFSSLGLYGSGAMTLSEGRGPLTGKPDPLNSIIPGVANGGYQLTADYHAPVRRWAVGNVRECVVTLFSFPGPGVPLMGLELEGGLDLTSAAVVDFGGSDVGVSVEKTISVINRGGSALNPGTPVVVGAGFTVTSPPLPATLAPGSAALLTLRFTPVAAGSASATLTLVSNAPDNNLFTLNLRGRGRPLPGLPFGDGGSPPVLTALPAGGTQVAFQAIPGRAYLLQRSFDLLTWPSVWQVLADENGGILFTDSDPRSLQAFYRIKAD